VRRLQALEGAGAGALRGHALHTTGLGRGLAAIAARRSPEFTEWDANLAGRPVPSPARGAVMSPTRLETWANCPFSYFLTSVLGLGARDAPELLDQVSPMERGSLLHEVLERFVTSALDTPPAPQEPWTPEDAARLHAIADEVFADAEARGVTGPTARWRRDEVVLRSVLDRFLRADSTLRAARGTTPRAVELAFGIGDAPPVTIELADGRTLAFRGRIDRVDTTAEGDVVVYDYKSGKGKSGGSKVSTLLLADPVLGGTRLQLPIYALAAAAALDTKPASSSYWYVEIDERAGFPLDDLRQARFREVLETITAGIDAGMFLASPGGYNAFFGTHDNCTYCEFDRLCPRDRGDAFIAKTADLDPSDARARFVSLAEVAEVAE
jgi:ATP-dependent helicase/nuclease subunit B